jgi:prephenate dehydratase
MSLEGQSIDDLTEVHSHPMALHQCRPFFDQYPNIKLVESVDTALSAKEIFDHQIKGRGAIAPKLSSELFHLPIMAKDIHTDKKNYTRFLILKRDDEHFIDPTSNKASLFFEVNDEVGSLAKVLTYLSHKQINLTKLQSFPILGKEWQYYFHADLEFDNLKKFNDTIENLIQITSALKILGI